MKYVTKYLNAILNKKCLQQLDIFDKKKNLFGNKTNS